MLDSLNENTKTSKAGQLSNTDFLVEFSSEDSLEIYSHKDILMKSSHTIHQSSIDITPSIVAMSVKTGMLEQVYLKSQEYTNRYFIRIKPRDAVLIISNELFFLTDYMTGYVTSCVSNFSNALIGDTAIVDPNWLGGLAIRLTNPTNKPIELEVGMATVTKDGEEPKFIYDTNPIASISFQYLSRPCMHINEGHKNIRGDLLEKISYKNKMGIIAFFRKTFYRKRRQFTDYFLEYIKVNEMDLITRKGWDDFLEKFSSVPMPDKKTRKKTGTTYDFLKKEIVIR